MRANSLLATRHVSHNRRYYQTGLPVNDFIVAADTVYKGDEGSETLSVRLTQSDHLVQGYL